MSVSPLVSSLRQIEVCERDGFPLVEVDGETYCSVEYADALVGGQQVIGVAESGAGMIALLFANGRTLPLTCPCCGGALHLKPRTLADVRALLIGRRLEGFRHGEWVGRGTPPARHPVFALQFSGDEPRDERTIEVALESVRRIGMRDAGCGMRKEREEE
jgi:hypothetical protein